MHQLSCNLGYKANLYIFVQTIKTNKLLTHKIQIYLKSINIVKISLCILLDSEPPKFTKCLGYQIGYTERGSDDGHIPTFQSPKVTDNIDKNIQPVLTSKTNPNSRLRRGVYIISYDAVDTAGNKAIGCKIKLVIKSKFVIRLFHLITNILQNICFQRLLFLLKCVLCLVIN